METLLAPARLVFSSQNLWLWIATSVLLSALFNGFTWRSHSAGSKKHSLLQWPLSLFREVGRFLYFVGLPYVALLSGLIPATEIGLVNREWLRDLTLSLPLGLGALLILMLLRALAMWREKTAPGGAAPSEPPSPFWTRLRESVYQEIHWAFYRSAPLLVLEERAQGIALGLGIVALEAWLDPAWRERWRHPPLASTALRTAGLTVLMAVIFGMTGNLWITLGLHLAVETAGGWAWSRISNVPALTE
jgi:hypothetical protein